MSRGELSETGETLHALLKRTKEASDFRRVIIHRRPRMGTAKKMRSEHNISVRIQSNGTEELAGSDVAKWRNRRVACETRASRRPIGA